MLAGVVAVVCHVPSVLYRFLDGDEGTYNTETFMMLPLSVALLLARPRDDDGERPGRAALFAAGALVGVACLWKQVAVSMLPVVGVAALWPSRGSLLGRRSARLAAVLSGFGCLLVLAAAELAREGSLSGLVHWAVVGLVGGYGPSHWTVDAVLVALITLFIPFVLASLLLWVAAGAALHRGRTLAWRERIVVLWLGAGIAGAASSGRFFEHYNVQLLPPLALLAALGIDRRLDAAPDRAARLRLVHAVAALTVLPALAFLAFGLAFEPWSGGVGRPSPDLSAVALYVRQATAREDRVFVWASNGMLYGAADRMPASRFVGFLRGLDRGHAVPAERSWDAQPEVWVALDEDFTAHPPEVIVDTSSSPALDMHPYPLSGFPAIQRWLDRRYRLEATIGGIDIYRLRPVA